MATAATAATTATTAASPPRAHNPKDLTARLADGRRGRGVLLAAVVVGLGVGCAPQNEHGSVPLWLRWSFVDGRNCADAGVVRVRVSDAGSLTPLALLASCEAGRVGCPDATPQ